MISVLCYLQGFFDNNILLDTIFLMLMFYTRKFEIYFISENYICNEKATITQGNVALNILYLA